MTQAILVFVALQIFILLSFTLYYNNRLSKFIVVLLLAVFANSVYFMFDGVKGWPTEDTSKVKGILSSVAIVNPTGTQEGAIYITVFPSKLPEWYEYVYHRESPRLFYVKYSNDRAAKFEEAKEAMEEGKEVRINGIPAETSSEGSDGQEGDNTITGMIDKLLDKIMSNQKDTYKPESSEIEIMEQTVPPNKGSNQ